MLSRFANYLRTPIRRSRAGGSAPPTCPIVTLSCARQRLLRSPTSAIVAALQSVCALTGSLAPQARQDLPFDLVTAHADDLQLVNRRQRLTVVGDDLTFDESLPLPDDLEGVIGLILFVEDGWIRGLEIWSASAFRNPEVFPPADVFGSPEVRTPS
jgi:hypothetical protein